MSGSIKEEFTVSPEPSPEGYIAIIAEAKTDPKSINWFWYKEMKLDESIVDEIEAVERSFSEEKENSNHENFLEEL